MSSAVQEDTDQMLTLHGPDAVVRHIQKRYRRDDVTVAYVIRATKTGVLEHGIWQGRRAYSRAAVRAWLIGGAR
jgi:hypothetical protein